MSRVNNSETMEAEGACREVRFKCNGREVALFMSGETIATADGDQDVIKARILLGPMDLSFRVGKDTAKSIGESLQELAER